MLSGHELVSSRVGLGPYAANLHVSDAGFKKSRWGRLGSWELSPHEPHALVVTLPGLFSWRALCPPIFYFLLLCYLQ